MSGNSRRRVADFGPADPTDNRQPLDWESKYPVVARRHIYGEAAYLGLVLLSLPPLMLLLWLRKPQVWWDLQANDYDVVLKYGLAWLAGTLGGVLFDLKWLYHSVARQSWHIDRRLWRLFTPHISGGLAFCIVALIESNLLRVFDQHIVNRSATVVGLAFLVGYFSDSSIAKLGEVADTLFGPSRSRQRHNDPSGRASKATSPDPAPHSSPTGSE